MSLIDRSYFIGELDIPNIDERPNTIDYNIEKYEKEFLIELLGQKLYDDFIAGLAEAVVDQKWLDLRDGADFNLDYCGQSVPLKWNGFINSEKVSPIAYYVYYKIRLEELSTTMGSAEVVANHENSVMANARRKMINSWNKLIDLYGEIRYDERYYNYYRNIGLNIMFGNYAVDCFDKYSETYDNYNDRPTAYNFLNTNRVDYEGWIFSPFRNMNEFGI